MKMSCSFTFHWQEIFRNKFQIDLLLIFAVDSDSVDGVGRRSKLSDEAWFWQLISCQASQAVVSYLCHGVRIQPQSVKRSDEWMPCLNNNFDTDTLLVNGCWLCPEIFIIFRPQNQTISQSDFYPYHRPSHGMCRHHIARHHPVYGGSFTGFYTFSYFL